VLIVIFGAGASFDSLGEYLPRVFSRDKRCPSPWPSCSSSWMRSPRTTTSIGHTARSAAKPAGGLQCASQSGTHSGARSAALPEPTAAHRPWPREQTPVGPAIDRGRPGPCRPRGRLAAARAHDRSAARLSLLTVIRYDVRQAFTMTRDTTMRRGWDSNPRRACTLSGFQDRRIRPLCHPSGVRNGNKHRRSRAMRALS
jgi:hypothetical protein